MGPEIGWKATRREETRSSCIRMLLVRSCPKLFRYGSGSALGCKFCVFYSQTLIDSAPPSEVPRVDVADLQSAPCQPIVSRLASAIVKWSVQRCCGVGEAPVALSLPRCATRGSGRSNRNREEVRL